MKITIKKADLLPALKLVKKVMEKNPVVPILENFHISVDNNICKVTATDLETTISITLPCESVETFDFLLPMAAEALVALSIDTVSFIIEETRLIIESKTLKLNFNLEDVLEYPKTLSCNGTSIDIDHTVLVDGFKSVMFCCGNDELRPVMTGISFINTFDNLSLCATDAHKLALVEIPIKAEVLADIIIPKIVATIINSIKNSGIGTFRLCADGYCSYTVGNIEIVFRPIDGRFPTYRSVIPESFYHSVEFYTPVLIVSVKSAMIAANKNTNFMFLKIGLNDTILECIDVDNDRECTVVVKSNFTDNHKELSEKELVKYKNSFSDDRFQIQVNAKMFLEMLSYCPDMVSIEIRTSKNALIFRNKNKLLLIMPIFLE